MKIHCLIPVLLLSVLLGSGCSPKSPEGNLPPGEENVAVQVKNGELKGTLRMPQEEAKSILVILIPGSGPTDRNGNNPQAGENNGLKMIAEALSQEGFSSLRYDKRGIGESKGLLIKESDLTFEDSITDVLAWVEKYQEDSRFSQIVLLGHSEGALIGAAAASRSTAVKALISVAGTAVPADELLLEQLKVQAPDLYEASLPLVEELRQGRLIPQVPLNLFSIFRPSVQPYLISWFSYDPREVLPTVKVPVLILHGDRDLQVPVGDAEKLQAANPNAELLIVPGMNHILKDAPEDPQGNFATYSDPDLPLSDVFITKVLEFLCKR